MVIKRPDTPASGVMLVNKPRGITSFDVISQLRKMTGVRRIGHAGTLDPFAEGLLLVMIGKATAIARLLENCGKTYELDMEFGRATDTFDLTGKETSSVPDGEAKLEKLRRDDFAALRSAVAGLEGDRMQVPPMYSAVKIGGKPLYVYARRGEEIGRPARPIHIGEAAILSIDPGPPLRARIRIRCSKGTYIRSLADELGRTVGTGAVAIGLMRMACGAFKLDEAWDLDTLRTLRETCPDSQAFISLLKSKGALMTAEKALAEYPTLEMPQDAAERLIAGQAVFLPASILPSAGLPEQDESAAPQGASILVKSSGKLVAIARLPAGHPDSLPDLVQIKTERVLIDLADFRQA